MKEKRDYYQELKKQLDDYEAHPWIDGEWHNLLTLICNKIVWCHDFHKITKEQCDELCDRATKIWDSFH